jgi:hypothetical protein
MKALRWSLAVGLWLAATGPAGALVTGGVLSVTLSHMS